MLWFEQGLECGEGCDIHNLWLVMLESAKDRVLGVDTLG
jgi:hypothetical protein